MQHCKPCSSFHDSWSASEVAYYLNCGSTKAERLVQFLNDVLGGCQIVELRVVATVCDMGTNSFKAIKLLAPTRSAPFFQFQNQAIATIYDPPHLLQYTNNLFLKYDVQFKSEHLENHLPVISKWEHIEKLYIHNRDFMI